MSIAFQHTNAGFSPRNQVAEQAQRILLLGLGFQVAMFLPSLMAYRFDERLINGINIWTKPLKFQISLSLHMATMLWLMSLVSKEWLSSRLMRWTAYVVSFSALVETAYITLQSARGRGSHYNTESAFEAFMWSLMGVGAVSLVAGSFILGVTIWRAKSMDQTGYRLGAILGLTIGSVLTLITAGYMSSSLIVESGRWVSGVKSDISGLPIVSWSTKGGDLRVSHFFATHIMQALPLVGLVSDKITPRTSRMLVIAIALLASALVAFTFQQALQGRPFLAF
jgi:hypothetical protein